MKYISLAAHNNELIIVNDMGEFTTHFCYSKKQRYGTIDVIVPAIENADEPETPITGFEIETADIADEDDI